MVEEGYISKCSCGGKDRCAAASAAAAAVLLLLLLLLLLAACCLAADWRNNRSVENRERFCFIMSSSDPDRANY